MKRAWIILGSAALLVALAGCGGRPAGYSETEAALPPDFLTALALTPTSTQTATKPPTATSTTEPTGTPTPTATPSMIGPSFPDNIDPLTGLPTDPALLSRRPLAVKVSNFPRSLRPHSGLSFADLVFHYYTEEGMTRFFALYLGTDSDQVGPIRSARPVDAQLTLLYQAILAYKGADAVTLSQLQKRLANRAISGKPSTCPAVCPGSSDDINSVFANTAAMTEYALSHGISEGRQNLDGMVFDPIAPSGGEDATLLHVQFAGGNRSEWRWDSGSGRWLRFIEKLDPGAVNMVELTDRLTGSQISSANVVVLFALYTALGGNEKYNIEFWSAKSGRALFFREGGMFEGTWEVRDPQAPLVFRDARGAAFPLKPGNTWFEVVGHASQLSQPAAGEWKILFRTP